MALAIQKHLMPKQIATACFYTSVRPSLAGKGLKCRKKNVPNHFLIFLLMVHSEHSGVNHAIFHPTITTPMQQNWHKIANPHYSCTLVHENTFLHNLS